MGLGARNGCDGKGDFGRELRLCSPFLGVKDCGEARWADGDLRLARGQGASVFEERPSSAPRSAPRPKGRAGIHLAKAGRGSVAKGATGKWGTGKFRTRKIGDFSVENLPVENRREESNRSVWSRRARCPGAFIRGKPAGAAWRRERQAKRLIQSGFTCHDLLTPAAAQAESLANESLAIEAAGGGARAGPGGQAPTACTANFYRSHAFLIFRFGREGGAG